jgi:hypothetical protein
MIQYAWDTTLFLGLAGVAYLLAWLRLRNQHAKTALHEMARLNPGIR